jgi:hypothetical protein
MLRDNLTTHDGFTLYKFLEGHVYDMRQSCAARIISKGAGLPTTQELTSEGWEFEKALGQGYKELPSKISVFTHYDMVTDFLDKGLCRLGYLQSSYDDLANTFNLPKGGKEWHLLLFKNGERSFVTISRLHKDKQIEDETLWIVHGKEAKGLAWLSDLQFKVPSTQEVLCG